MRTCTPLSSLLPLSTSALLFVSCQIVPPFAHLIVCGASFASRVSFQYQAYLNKHLSATVLALCMFSLFQRPQSCFGCLPSFPFLLFSSLQPRPHPALPTPSLVPAACFPDLPSLFRGLSNDQISILLCWLFGSPLAIIFLSFSCAVSANVSCPPLALSNLLIT